MMKKNNPVLYNAVSDDLKPPLVMCFLTSNGHFVVVLDAIFSPIPMTKESFILADGCKEMNYFLSPVVVPSGNLT